MLEPPLSTLATPPPLAGSGEPVGLSTDSPAAAQSAPPAASIDAEADRRPSTLETILTTMPSWLLSLVVHMAVLVMLALSTIGLPQVKSLEELTFGTAETTSEEPDFLDSAEFSAVDQPQEAMEATQSIPSELVAAMPELNLTAEPSPITPLPSFNPIDVLNPVQGEFTAVGGTGTTELLRGRSAAEKVRLLREGGGTEGSEAAVQNALVWLKNHQNPDGSWSFRPLGGVCGCPNPGLMAEAYIGGTAMALLPFLGAGHTHEEGAYREVVRGGLYYLLSRQQTSGSLYEPSGRMYSHGLGSIVLCEAYAMTRDRNLARPAQAALQFTAYAQDPIGGGWRYEVQEPGDTSVVGWQLMALKSGHMAQLEILPVTLERTQKFLNSVQSDDGAAYGYQRPGSDMASATTAIGILCRMYLGWTHENPALQRAVERIGKRGPSDVDMYYNYYATQVMRHYGGEPWEKWNVSMRDWLVKSQAKNGHQAGSWHVGDSHSANQGGRLYSTSMATMILEVYYRHLPIYQSGAVEDFEL
jgi:hypothetical protein